MAKLINWHTLTLILLIVQICLATTFLENGDIATVELCDSCMGAILDLCIIYPSNIEIAFPTVNVTIYINDKVVREEVIGYDTDWCYYFSIPDTCKKSHYYYTIVANIDINYEDSSESFRLCYTYLVLTIVFSIFGFFILIFAIYWLAIGIYGLLFCVTLLICSYKEEKKKEEVEKDEVTPEGSKDGETTYRS